MIKIPVSVGELLDKITILEIKVKKGIKEGIKFQKNKNIRKFNIFSPDPLNLKGPRPGSDEWKNQFKS